MKLKTQDIILINAKMKSLCINRKALVRKTRVSLQNINDALNGKDVSITTEVRLLEWLNKK